MDYDSITVSIQKAWQFIFQTQKEAGNWEGKIFYNIYPTALTLVINKMLGISQPDWEKKAIDLIHSTQRQDGSWFLLDKPPLKHPAIDDEKLENWLEVKASTVRNTEMALLALELFEDDQNAIKRGRDFLRNIKEDLLDPFTVIFLAYFKKRSWKDVKIPPIEILLLPDNFKYGINRFIPIWIRDASIGALLFKTLVENKFKWSPLRKIAIKKAINILIKNQLSNGSWFGTFQPTVYPILALSKYNSKLYSSNIQKGLEFLEARKNKESGYMHRFILPVWDTALTLMALKTSGLENTHPAVKKAKSYLFNSRFPSKLWGFCPEVEIYPDSDDTAACIKALTMAGVESDYFKESRDWLINQQNKNGGWAAFTKDQATKKPGALPTTIEDSMVILQDPSVADITGHVLEVLGLLDYTKEDRVVKKAIEFLKKDQVNGIWYGRWGLCYIYAVTRVLNGLRAVKEDMNQEYIQKAIKWLINIQNDDGGWGEHYIAYFKTKFAGQGKSTPAQTGWALDALAPILSKDSPVIKKGISYLLNNQLADGSWHAYSTVGALEIYENTNYGAVFGLLGLGKSYSGEINERKN